VYLIGEFHEKEAVVGAIRKLKAYGIGPDSMDLFSDEPVELPGGVLDRPTSMSLAGVCGASLFGVAATAFIWWTQNNYRLHTGGMPVFSFWATGVITYEMTMLGAIVVIFGWFLWESGLLRRRDKLAPVPVVDPGSICLRVRCNGNEVSQADEAMRHMRALSISSGGTGRDADVHACSGFGRGSRGGRPPTGSMGERPPASSTGIVQGKLRGLPRHRPRTIQEGGTQFLPAGRQLLSAVHHGWQSVHSIITNIFLDYLFDVV
jgi:hypothetical protein